MWLDHDMQVDMTSFVRCCFTLYDFFWYPCDFLCTFSRFVFPLSCVALPYLSLSLSNMYVLSPILR